MNKIQYYLKIISNRKICGKYFHLVLNAKMLASRVRPGQFIHIRVNDDFEPLFRRPFSVYRARGGRIEIFYEPVGKGTRILMSKGKGDALDILGPLGRPFTLPGKEIKQIVFIAGGIGVAPFLMFADALKSHKAKKLLLYGGRTKEHTFAMTEFKKNGIKVFVATEDGYVGVKGRVSALFSKIAPDPAATMLYTCGPNPMIAAVQGFARDNGFKGEASVEELMACGLGACLGCSIRTKSGYRTVCHDGPVFTLEELIF